MPAEISIIVATHNRGALLERLLRQISEQQFPMQEVEVIVVDDGSVDPVAPKLHALAPGLAFPLTVITQANAGAAAARQNAVSHAKGELLLIVDDDMQLPPQFIAEHVRVHREGSGSTCVMGRCASDPSIRTMPLFERYHAKLWDQHTTAARAGRIRVNGTMLATGNVSMRRCDFLSVGGFDASLERAEDTELGLKLERAGVDMVFSEAAYTLHGSDHTDVQTWLGRNYRYGMHHLRIARQHAWAAHADPWRFVFSLPKLGLPFVAVSVLTPGFSRRVSGAMFRTAMIADELGMEKLALRGAGVVFGMEYFRGVRMESGSVRDTVWSFTDFLAKTHLAEGPPSGVPPLLKRLGRAALALRRSCSAA